MLDSVDIMLGAMYGDAGFTFPVDLATGVGDASKIKQTFLGRGKMIRPNWAQSQNTTLSVIITLQNIQPFLMQLVDWQIEDPSIDYEAEMRQRIPDFDPNLQVQRVIVWHNAVARIPFPNNLFCSEFDTHYDVVRLDDGAVEQNVTFEGDLVPNRLKKKI